MSYFIIGQQVTKKTHDKRVGKVLDVSTSYRTHGQRVQVGWKTPIRGKLYLSVQWINSNRLELYIKPKKPGILKRLYTKLSNAIHKGRLYNALGQTQRRKDN